MCIGVHSVEERIVYCVSFLASEGIDVRSDVNAPFFICLVAVSFL